MGEVIADDRKDFSVLFDSSKLNGIKTDEVQAMHTRNDRWQPSDERQYKQSWAVQAKLLIGRSAMMYWRSPNFSFARLFVIGFVAVLMGTIIYQQDPKTAADAQTRLSVMAFT